MKKKRLQKSELIYLGLSLFMFVFLAIAINNEKINSTISSWNPLLQFFMLQGGLYVTFFGFFKFVSSGNKRKANYIKWSKNAWKSALGTVLVFMATDLILPEYHVTANGLVAGGVFGKSSLDYIFGYIFNSLGASGWLLWILTYPIAFTLIYTIGSLIYRNFVSELG